jgi:hypothetical protein
VTFSTIRKTGNFSSHPKRIEVEDPDIRTATGPALLLAFISNNGNKTPSKPFSTIVGNRVTNTDTHNENDKK